MQRSKITYRGTVVDVDVEPLAARGYVASWAAPDQTQWKFAGEVGRSGAIELTCATRQRPGDEKRQGLLPGACPWPVRNLALEAMRFAARREGLQ